MLEILLFLSLIHISHEQFGKKINDNLVFLNLEGKAYIEKAVDDAIDKGCDLSLIHIYESTSPNHLSKCIVCSASQKNLRFS